MGVVVQVWEKAAEERNQTMFGVWPRPSLVKPSLAVAGGAAVPAVPSEGGEGGRGEGARRSWVVLGRGGPG